MDYFFQVNVIYTSFMQTQINELGLTSATLTNIETDASTDPLTVDLTFSAQLSDADLATLTSYMNSYTDPTVSQNAINSINTALETDSNVIILARAKIQATIATADVLTLLQICALLGINPNL